MDSCVICSNGVATAVSTYAHPPNPQLLPCPVDSCSPQHTLNTHTYRRGCKRSYLFVSGRRRVAVTQLMMTVTASHTVGTSVNVTVCQGWLHNNHILIPSFHIVGKKLSQIFLSVLTMRSIVVVVKRFTLIMSLQVEEALRIGPKIWSPSKLH